MGTFSDYGGLKLAYLAALDSPDPSTQVGAVICDRSGKLIGVACNDFPIGVLASSDRLERPLKYSVVEHAERGAIYQAAKSGLRTKKATMFTLGTPPCADCSRACICAGISRVVVHQVFENKMKDHPAWIDSCSLGRQMLYEAGVEVSVYEGKVGTAPIRFNGELVYP